MRRVDKTLKTERTASVVGFVFLCVTGAAPGLAQRSTAAASAGVHRDTSQFDVADAVTASPFALRRDLLRNTTLRAVVRNPIEIRAQASANHQVRNVLIGAAVGTIVGTIVGVRIGNHQKAEECSRDCAGPPLEPLYDGVYGALAGLGVGVGVGWLVDRGK